MGISKVNTIFKRNGLIVILALLFICCSFTVPYLFPSDRIRVSMSYDHGFSNRVGLIIVAMSIVCFAIIGLLKGRNESIVFNESSCHLGKNVLFTGAGIVVLFVAMAGILCGNQLITDGYECSYFLPHVFDLKAGKTPYVDFQFFYGPLMIYVPFGLYSMIPGISVLWAYLISLLLFHLVGLYALFDIINGLNIDRKRKRWVFWIAFISFFPLALGMNYELLRFMLPYWCLYRLNKTDKSIIALLFPVSIAVCFALSPEIGVVYFLTVLVYCAAQWVISHRWTYLLAILLSLLLSISVYVLCRPMFSTLLSFSSGMLNFPFMPCLHLFVFFVSVIVVAFHSGTMLRQWKEHIFELSFIFLSFCMIPACLGRCDPGHVVYDGFFILMMAFIVMTSSGRKVRSVATAFYLALFLILMVFPVKAYTWSYFTLIEKNHSGWVYHHHEEVSRVLKGFHLPERKVEKMLHKCDSFYAYGQTDVLAQLLPEEESVALPLVFDNDVLACYVRLSEMKRINNLYVARLSMSGDIPNVERTINQMRDENYPFLVLADNWDKITEPTDYSFYIKYLFCTYYSHKSIQNGNLVYQPVVEYIKTHYHLAKSSSNLCLYEKNEESDECKEDIGL